MILGMRDGVYTLSYGKEWWEGREEVYIEPYIEPVWFQSKTVVVL